MGGAACLRHRLRPGHRVCAPNGGETSLSGCYMRAAESLVSGMWASKPVEPEAQMLPVPLRSLNQTMLPGPVAESWIAAALPLRFVRFPFLGVAPDGRNLSVQVYKAERPKAVLKVYNLWYSNSLEYDRYTTALQREQKVFEDLIQQKAYIVLPDVTQVRC